MSAAFTLAPTGRFDDEALTAVVEGSDLVIAMTASHRIVHLRLPLAAFKAAVAALDDPTPARRRGAGYLLTSVAATPEPPDETQSAPPAAPTAAPTAARVSSGTSVPPIPGVTITPAGIIPAVAHHPSPAMIAAAMPRRSVILGSN